jgi:hypothetical protein
MKLEDFEALTNARGLVAMTVIEGFAPFSVGDVAGFTPDEALRLFNRGAVAVPGEAKTARRAAPVQPKTEGEAQIEIPEDWATMHHLKRVSLAGKLAERKVETKEEADAIIGAEVERRAALAGPGA